MVMCSSELNGSQECQDAAVPFMCQYMFPLCDNDTGELYLPTQEECLRISNQVCSQEWNIAKQFGYGDQLPHCAKLPPGRNGIINNVIMIVVLYIYRMISMGHDYHCYAY